MDLPAISFLSRFKHPFFVKHAVMDDCALIRRINRVDLAVSGLEKDRVSEGVVLGLQVAPIWPGLSTIFRYSNTQRCSLGHVVIIDQHQIVVLKLDQVHGRIRVRKRGIHTL